MVTRERVIVLAEKNIFLNWAKLGRTEAREAAEWNILLGRGSIKIYRIWRHKGRTPTENVPKLFWVCVSLTACWDWGLQGLESAVFGVCSKSQTLSFSFHYLHKAVTWWRGLASLCTAVLGNSLLQHTLEIHHWSKPLTFKSFADPFSYDMWSIENPSVHHHVCAVVQGRALVHCGNSSLQDRSCEIVQKGRCAMEQESTYSSLGHLHQKKKKENMSSVCICDGLCAATWWWRPQNTKSSAGSLGNVSSSKGTPGQWNKLGLGCLWLNQCIFHCHWKFACPKGLVAVEIFAGVAFVQQGLSEAEGLWRQSKGDSLALGLWHSTSAGFWKDSAFQQLFEPCG